MRNVPEGVLDLWRRKGFKVDAKVSVYDGTSWVDLDTWQNKKWLYYISIEDDIDRDVIEATVRLASSEGNFSISPFVYEDTPLQVWRKIKIEACLLPTGTWTNIFEGYIDSIEVTQDEITVRCRDYGALLIDTFIEEERTYGTDNGTAVEGEMQKILDDNLGSGVVSLYVPSSPNWYVKKWKQEKKSVMEALRDLTDQIGWLIRYKWDSSTNQWRLTLWQPQRSNSTPSLILSDTNFFSIKRLGIEVARIRNKVSVKYIDASTATLASYTAQDDTSISTYGKRYMEINCGKTSNIDTSSEAQTLANNVLADLKDHKVELEIEVPFAPFLEIGDCIQLKKNLLLHSDQTVYVDSISHDISVDSATSTLKLSGTAKYGTRRWLQIENRVHPEPIEIRSTIFNGSFLWDHPHIWEDVPNSNFRCVWDSGEVLFEVTFSGVGFLRFVKVNNDGSLTEILRRSIAECREYDIWRVKAFLERDALYKFQVRGYDFFGIDINTIRLIRYEKSK